MIITKEKFTELVKKAVSCMATPYYARYRLSDGSKVYNHFGFGYSLEASNAK